MKTVNRLVALALALACVLAAPLFAVAEPVASESPSWTFSGVELSATRVTSGQEVTVTPVTSGDLEGAEYNYVWSYGGGWDLWGSTVRDTGRGTGDATGTLALTKPGAYTVYVDVTDRAGEKRTMSATLEVTPPSWSFSGVEVSSSRVRVDEPVTVTPVTSGDLGGAEYNYVWSYGGGWDLWGSTVKDTGRGTSEASSELTLARAGTYTLYVDVTDRSGQKRTMSAQLVVSSPSWSFTGVRVSPSRVRVDEPVTVTPVTSGDLAGAEYNYVWSYGGGWDLWGSTVKDTGSGTPDAAGTLSLSRPGRYVVYVDVTDRSGQKRTMSAGVEAYDDSWSLDGVSASASSVTAGDEVTYAPMVSGDASGLRYNYVWQWQGSWAEGDWGSTELHTGSDTAEASHTGALGSPGRYTLYVDAVSARGERRTASTQVVAWGATGVSVSGSAASGWTASADLFEGHEVPGTKYRFRWEAADGSASGTLSDWSGASSIWFSASTLGDSGDFRIVMDAKYPNRKTFTLTSDTVTYLTRAQRAVVDSAYKTSSYRGVSGWCAAWVSKVFASAGYGWYNGDANDMYWAWCHSSNLSELRAGMVIAVDKSPTRLGSLYGHIGIYVGNGLVHDDEGYVREMTLRDWLNFYSQAGQPKWGWAGNVSLA